MASRRRWDRPAACLASTDGQAVARRGRRGWPGRSRLPLGRGRPAGKLFHAKCNERPSWLDASQAIISAVGSPPATELFRYPNAWFCKRYSFRTRSLGPLVLRNAAAGRAGTPMSPLGRQTMGFAQTDCSCQPMGEHSEYQMGHGPSHRSRSGSGGLWARRGDNSSSKLDIKLQPRLRLTSAMRGSSTG